MQFETTLRKWNPKKQNAYILLTFSPYRPEIVATWVDILVTDRQPTKQTPEAPQPVGHRRHQGGGTVAYIKLDD